MDEMDGTEGRDIYHQACMGEARAHKPSGEGKEAEASQISAYDSFYAHTSRVTFSLPGTGTV